MSKSKIKPRAEVELRLCKSKKTGKLYYGLYDKEEPLKFWSVNDLSPSAIDLISELVNAFDLGYDVRFQFPKADKDGNRKLVPQTITMYNEPED